MGMTMNEELKPMLAETCEDTSKLEYPIIASPKLDGIRCLIRDGVALSRNLKLIPNKHVQAWVKRNQQVLNGCDGELVVDPHDATVFNRTTSAVMSKDGPDTFTFYCFDRWDDPLLGYTYRMREIKSRVAERQVPDKFRFIPQRTCATEDGLLDYEKECLQRGYEGLMVRDPTGYYKYGRSTVRAGLLLKVKRFKDDEATVIGFEERQHNENEAKKDQLGHTERSTHKAGMKPAGDLGALIVKKGEVTFNIGSGFTAEQRLDFWRKRDTLKGKLVKFKHFEQGAVDKPRFPIFLGFRHEDDK